MLSELRNGRYFPGVSSPFFIVLTIAQVSGKLRTWGFVLVEHVPILD